MAVDLSKRRDERRKAAEREGTNTAPEFTFEGKTFVLPVEMPMQVSIIAGNLTKLRGTDEQKGQAMATGLSRIGKILLRSDYDKFLELGASFDDHVELMEALPEMYGVDSGESPASE